MTSARADVQGPAYRIRPATAQDTEAVAALARQLGYRVGLRDLRRRLAHEDWLDAILVADPGDGPIVGWVQVWVNPPIVSPGDEAEIVGLVVDAGSRRRGVGRALVAAAESWAAQRRCTAIRVRSNVTRSAAHDFYAGCGYVTLKTQHVYRRALPPTASEPRP